MEKKMGFEIIDNPSTETNSGFTTLSRTDKPEFMTWSPVSRNRLSRKISVFWSGALPQGALEEAWKQAGLELVSAKCRMMIDGTNIKQPPAKTVRTVQAVEQFVADNAARPAFFACLMKVRPENATAKPKHSMLYFAGEPGEPSASLLEGKWDTDFGCRFSRKNWEQPEIRQFILNVFRKTFVDGEVTQSDIDGLTEKSASWPVPKR